MRHSDDANHLLSGTELVDEFHPRNLYARYDNGRLTKRGVKICYRLFDRNESTLAVAYLLDLSLSATRNRKKLWQAAGGTKRPSIDLASLPRRRFYAKYND